MYENWDVNERLLIPREQPIYSLSEAAHLARVSKSTVRNWLFGYRDKRRPLFRTPEDQGPMVSFLQLIEIVVAGKFRKAERVPFQRVRTAYENAIQQFQLTYPFAHLRLEALGGHIVSRMHEEEPGSSRLLKNGVWLRNSGKSGYQGVAVGVLRAGNGAFGGDF